MKRVLSFLERIARLWTKRDDPFFRAIPLGYKQGMRACLADRAYRKSLVSGSKGQVVLFILYHPSCYRIFSHLLKDPRLGRNGREIRILSLNPQHGDDFIYPCAYDLADLLNAFRGKRVALAVLSSDFAIFKENFHRKGCALGDYFQSLGADRMVVQHGGSRGDTMRALSTSGSRIFCVWGNLAASSLQHHGIAQERIHVVGNISRGVEKHSVVNYAGEATTLIAGCMHREYPDVADGCGAYQEWLKAAVETFLKYGKVRIRKHPMDDILAGGRTESVVDDYFTGDCVEVVSAEETLDESLSAANVVVSRASTVIEEGLLKGLGAVAVDFSRQPYLASQEVLAEISQFECFTFDEIVKLPSAQESVQKLFVGNSTGDESRISQCSEYLDFRDKEDPLKKVLALIDTYA